MYKHITLLLCFSLILGLDTDWANYEGHEISLNSIIIKINNEFAPKLGIEAPLTIDQIIGLRDLDENNNLKNFEPLFRHYASFSELHYAHDLHSYYNLEFDNPINISKLKNELENIKKIESAEFNFRKSINVIPNDSN